MNLSPEQIEGLPAQLQLVANRSFAGQMKADDWRTVDDASHAITQLQEQNANYKEQIKELVAEKYRREE